jgi:hypothetical protein
VKNVKCLSRVFLIPVPLLKKPMLSQYSDWLRAGRPEFHIWHVQEDCLYSTASIPALGPTQPPSSGHRDLFFLRIKLPGVEADHSPPSSAEVNYGVATPPLPCASSWHDV